MPWLKAWAMALVAALILRTTGYSWDDAHVWNGTIFLPILQKLRFKRVSGIQSLNGAQLSTISSQRETVRGRDGGPGDQFSYLWGQNWYSDPFCFIWLSWGLRKTRLEGTACALIPQMLSRLGTRWSPKSNEPQMPHVVWPELRSEVAVGFGAVSIAAAPLVS